ncbi:urea transporter [Mycolicibacterium komossense]|uniref:Urea transporter n=1 Tax=Mycolicibacterium komossense TaxID=1779 RepID=A0ABT3CF19_9MYCO|nr:urea transporter [Mycolicibacterium komossense]MCV7227996.1 urea transporter [Mycolicibacterium komossense]
MGLGTRWTQFRPRGRVATFADLNFKGAGQVFFQENSLTGVLFLAGIAYGAVVAKTPQVLLGAVIGLLVSTITAIALQPDEPSLRKGLYGYNGVLVGAALPTFLGITPMLWFYLVVASAASTVVFMATATVCKTWGVPALTFPFNLVNWIFLMGAFQFMRLRTTDLNPGQFPSQVTGAAAHVNITPGFLVEALLKNIAQVFLINNAITGAIFVVALVVSSVWAGVFALGGSALAIGASLAMGAPAPDIHSGLYGFSAVLTAVALGCVFYRPSPRVTVFAIFGVLVTVAIHSMLVSALTPVSLPPGTAPFVFATWLFLLPKKRFDPVQHEHLAGGAAEPSPLARATTSKSVNPLHEKENQ